MDDFNFSKDFENHLYSIIEGDLENLILFEYALFKLLGYSTVAVEMIGDNIVSKVETNPEKLLIKLEAFERLSYDARKVIKDILREDPELMAIAMSPIHKKINSKRIWKYFRRIWGRGRTRRVKAEIESFVKNL